MSRIGARIFGVAASLAAMACTGAPVAGSVFSVSGASDVADTFVREQSPDTVYDTRGGLSVSGAAALNKYGDPTGLADSFLKFNLTNAVSQFDSDFGPDGWEITQLRLILTEQGPANNAEFSTGQGTFQVFWLGDDSWLPAAMTWPAREGLLAATTSLSLGVFENEGTGDQRTSFRTLDLDLPAELAAHISGAGEVSLYLTAVSESIGFTFNSSDITASGTPPRLGPELQLTPQAVPAPSGLLMMLTGSVVWMRRPTRRH